jgi:hypothetical protein
VFEAGYRTILVTDACADRGRERHDAALALYGDYMYELRSVQSLKIELEGQQQVVQQQVEGKKKKKKSLNKKGAMSSIMEGVSVSLPFHKDGGDNVGRRDKKMITMIKSESNDSLTSATSYDDSVSSIEDHVVGEAVSDE